MRLGLFGGAFDPIHNGHLMIIDQCLEELALDSLWVIPAASPPHRMTQAGWADRFEMCRTAILGSNEFDGRVIVSDVEEALYQSRHRPSYTSETIEEIIYLWQTCWKAKIEEIELFLILGEDEWRDLPRWHDPKYIARAANIVCALRSSVRTPAPLRRALLPHERVSIINVPGALGFDATTVRERVRTGRSIKHLVQPGVRQYIAKNHLYGEK